MKFGEPLTGGDWTLHKGTDLIGKGDREGVKNWQNIFSGNIGLQMFAENRGYNCIALRDGHATFKKFDQVIEREEMDEDDACDTWVYEPPPEEGFKIWSATTKAVEGHQFRWDESGATNISKVKYIRFDVRGKSDSYFAFSTEASHSSDKICYQLGGWNNTTSTGGWQKKGDEENKSWYQQPDDPTNTSVHRGKKIHAGMHKSVWFECELNVEGDSEGPYIEFSSIKGEDGSGKQLMSRWSMKGIKPTWLMVASGMGKTALINAYLYFNKIAIEH